MLLTGTNVRIVNKFLKDNKLDTTIKLLKQQIQIHVHNMKNAYPNELKVPSGFSKRDEEVFPHAILLLFLHIGQIIFFV